MVFQGVSGKLRKTVFKMKAAFIEDRIIAKNVTGEVKYN